MSGITVSGDKIDMAVRQLFETYDKNRDGKLSVEELFPLFNTTLKTMGKERRPHPVEVKEFIREFDLNQDGELDFDEMRTMFRKVVGKATVSPPPSVLSSSIRSE
jgi:Ca2+-binding EF-hand superfamily protein